MKVEVGHECRLRDWVTGQDGVSLPPGIVVAVIRIPDGPGSGWVECFIRDASSASPPDFEHPRTFVGQGVVRCPVESLERVERVGLWVPTGLDTVALNGALEAVRIVKNPGLPAGSWGGIYRKKAPVRAALITGEADVPPHAPVRWWHPQPDSPVNQSTSVAYVQTDEGELGREVPFYLCQGPAGEWWPVRKDIFEATYGRADA